MEDIDRRLKAENITLEQSQARLFSMRQGSQQSRLCADLGLTTFDLSLKKGQSRNGVKGKRRAHSSSQTSNSSQTSLRSTMLLPEDADDDELNLRQDQSLIDSPHKIITDSTGYSSNGHPFHRDFLPKLLPSFKKTIRDVDPQLPPPKAGPSRTRHDENSTPTSSSSPAKRRSRTRASSNANSSQCGRGSTTATGTMKERGCGVVKPRPAYKNQERPPTPSSSSVHLRTLASTSQSEGKASVANANAIPKPRRRKAPKDPLDAMLTEKNEAAEEGAEGSTISETAKLKTKARFPTTSNNPLDALLDEKRRTDSEKELEDIPDSEPFQSTSKSSSKGEKREGTVSSRSSRASLARHDFDVLMNNVGVDMDGEIDREITNIEGERRLQPFPMALPTPPASSLSKRLSDGDSSPPKRRRSSGDGDVSFGVDFSFTQEEKVDPNTICPFCDQPYPADPTPLLQQMMRKARAKAYRGPRPLNALGLKGDLTSYMNMCQRHRFEVEQLPKAKSKGWPERIDFEALSTRIEAFRRNFEKIIDNKERSSFWKELKEQIEENGLNKTIGIAGQMTAFQDCQPGYYGELGSMIIYHTLCDMFPLGSLDPQKLHPLPATDFIQRILVPETGVLLIRADTGTDRAAALVTLRASTSYGAEMFPVHDKEDLNGIEDKMLRKRARARRKELELEERELGDTSEASEVVDVELGTLRGMGKGRSGEALSENRNGRAKAKLGKSTAKRKAIVSNEGETINLTDSEMESDTTSWSATSRSNAKCSSKKTTTRRSPSGDVEVATPEPPRPRPRPAYATKQTADPEATPKPIAKAQRYSKREDSSKSRPPMNGSCNPLELARSRRSASRGSKDVWSYNMRNNDTDAQELTDEDYHPRQRQSQEDSHDWLFSGSSQGSRDVD